MPAKDGPAVSRPLRVYLGIDPGSRGGLAALKTNGQFSVTAMPATERDLFLWLAAHCQREHEPIALIEQVTGYVKPHREGDDSRGNRQPGHTMFVFGQGYGALRMALVALGVRFETVTPRVWQKAVGITGRNGATDSVWKNRLKARAQELFPKVNVTLATADALLIAEVCRRRGEGRS